MPTFTRVLLYRLPMLYGSDVQAMQMRLHSHGVRQVGVADGLFGSQTDVAVRAFQQAHGLRIDGVVGPLTWEALFEDVKHQEIDTKVELFWEELQQPHGFGKEEDIGTSCEWSLTSESEEKIIKRMGIKISKPLEIPIDEWPDSNPSYYPQTRGKPKTVQKVWQNFGGSIEKWALEFGIPVELIVATICTESRGDPEALREEPNYVSDEKTPHQVSPGLMQTLISTARETLGDHSIDREWLFIPEHSIRAGTAYIARQWKKNAS